MTEQEAIRKKIELIAGRHPSGEIIAEQIPVITQQDKNQFLLEQSPVFVRGIARGDIIEAMDNPKGAFGIVRHGGNLCIRVYSQTALADIAAQLTAAIEKLGGTLDVATTYTLVYSIHVSCGFQQIEQLLNQHTEKYPQSGWLYGNVYDPENGEPLNWWQSHLQAD